MAGLTIAFRTAQGDLTVVRDVGFELAPGEVVADWNGAGWYAGQAGGQAIPVKVIDTAVPALTKVPAKV